MDNNDSIKQWLVCIDVPLWVSALGNNNADWKCLLSLLDDILPANMQLLYRKEMSQLGTVSPDKHWVLASKLSKKSTVGYPICDNARYIDSSPDICAAVSDDLLKNEISSQIAFLYNRDGSVPRPVLATGRIRESEVVLTRDKKKTRVLHVCGTSAGDIQRRINGLLPILCQEKHFMFERNMGKGRIASTFSAYDKNNTAPAVELLSMAFRKYGGENLPASSLWAWDKVHECFVQFMHSGNNQYHGHDEKDLKKVPVDVKKAFH